MGKVWVGKNILRKAIHGVAPLTAQIPGVKTQNCHFTDFQKTKRGTSVFINSINAKNITAKVD